MASSMFKLLVLSIFFSFAWAQTIQTITVGEGGSFFIPQAVIARKGDIISFKWTGAAHSVTQSSFDNPCTPLQGGFDSGVTGNAQGQPLTIPVWNLTITDDSQPIWFFCKVSQPIPHCTTGMVGAINANPQGDNQTFDQFLASAKAVMTVPTIPRGQPPSLTGIGAVASTTPIPSMNSTNATTTSSSMTSTSMSSSTLPPTTTSAAPAVTTTASSGLSTGAKAGIAGGIAGAAVLTALIVLLIMQFRRAAKYRKEADVASNVYREKPAPLTPDYTHPLSYERYMARQPRAPGSTSGVSIPESIDPESTTSAVNVKELAAEIVRNLKQETAAQNGGRTPGLESVPEHVIEEHIARGMGMPTGGVPHTTPTDVSSRGGSSSTRSGVTATAPRQLPMPPGPPPMPNNPRFSMETLPAYH